MLEIKRFEEYVFKKKNWKRVRPQSMKVLSDALFNPWKIREWEVGGMVQFDSLSFDFSKNMFS